MSNKNVMRGGPVGWHEGSDVKNSIWLVKNYAMNSKEQITLNV